MTRFRVDTPERNYCIAHADTCAIEDAHAENCVFYLLIFVSMTTPKSIQNAI